MKRILFLLILAPDFCFSQVIIQCTVKDGVTKEPLVYCSVGIKGSSQGSITNDDGVFRISVNTATDTLILSYVGYKRKVIAAGSLKEKDEIFLESIQNSLKEIVVHADDDYLYDILQQCRDHITQTKPYTAKVFFELETAIANQPVEILECYYNGKFRNSSVEELLFKNGRGGDAPAKDSGFFHSYNTSRAVTDLNLAQENANLPYTPFQFSKSKLKKKYTLKIISFYEDERPVYRISFSPRENSNDFFGGEVWIDKSSFLIQKIKLSVREANRYPFLPNLDDTVAHVSMDITETFKLSGEQNYLEHIDFNYDLTYKEGPEHLKLSVLKSQKREREIRTNGILYIYDYENPFILPYYKYASEQDFSHDPDRSDYRKITSFPYNQHFWENNTALVHTERQEKNVDFINRNGLLYNFKTVVRRTDSMMQHVYGFEDNLVTWCDTARISLKENFRNSVSKQSEVLSAFRSDQYHLDAQIYLDVNRSGDSLTHFSASLFDVFESYYHLPTDSTTDCFLNIYFDICEIERHKLETALSLNSYNESQIDSLYRQTLKSLDDQARLYLKEVQTGQNIRALKKWNQYIVENLEVDNMKCFRLDDR
jgi:hypothetical protein